jgi:hypothetical protein
VAMQWSGNFLGGTSGLPFTHRETCPYGPHRGPQGPNEDLSVCRVCWSPSWEMRPEGQTFGHHLPDCSLPLRHESYCEPGGEGHPPAELIRG